MKLGTKVFIDQLIGSVLIAVLLAVRPRRRAGATAPIAPKTIAVLKLLGLGSIVQATPLLAALRNRYPGARIVFVTRKGNEDLTDRIPGIDSTLVIDDTSLRSVARTTLRTLKTLRSMQHACFVNLEAYSRLGTVVTALSGAKWTAGFYRQPSDFRLRAIYDAFVYFNAGAPISEVYLQLGRALDTGELSPSLLELQTSAEDVHAVEKVLGALDIPLDGATLIAVNPNASQLRLERRWPAERFAELIDALIDQVPGCRVLLVGSAAERDCTASVLRAIKKEGSRGVVDLAGALSLGGLIALLRKSALLVTNDSGPMHMALSVGTPTLALFGPVDPGHYFSRETKARHAVLYHRVYCSPCVHHFDVAPCRGDNVCMKRITTSEVLRTAISLLRDEPVHLIQDTKIVYLELGQALGVLGDRPQP